MRAALLVLLLAGCDITLAQMDNVYSHGMDHPVLCSMSVDNKNVISDDSIAQALDRAQVDGTILHLYSHRPNGTVDESTIESVVASAADRGLTYLTYHQLLAGIDTPGLALSFDDHNIAAWMAMRPILDLYQAKVTFFISAYHSFGDEDKAALRELAADGHDIEYHSTNHADAQLYEQTYGVPAYIADDILPDLTLMRADGWDPKVFAYPFGHRSDALDAALLDVFPLVRASHHLCPN